MAPLSRRAAAPPAHSSIRPKTLKTIRTTHETTVLNGLANDVIRKFNAPRPFFLLPRVSILHHYDAFVTNFTAAQFRNGANSTARSESRRRRRSLRLINCLRPQRGGFGESTLRAPLRSPARRRPRDGLEAAAGAAVAYRQTAVWMWNRINGEVVSVHKGWKREELTLPYDVILTVGDRRGFELNRKSVLFPLHSNRYTAALHSNVN
ncbi:hypothetical protein EVAR_16558_1 [Eumeta japonica]|uniref:Uncharacterized protein n=1 Tax=Eumeta variegata TaxID=151549 RepID=A0A4C1U2U8_EUMVA|nr:hypothetical protein EVAR_16558_1 [Eumeta japonica]